MNHATLATLSREGMLPKCLTLNFDLLIEEAIAALRCSCRTQCPLMDDEFHFGSGPTRTTVIKPHGSFTPSHVAPDPYRHLSATLSQAGRHVAPENLEAVRDAVSECPVLFVAGYSDDDWDIFPIFARLAPQLRRIVWFQHARLENIDHPDKVTDVPAVLHEHIKPWLVRSGVPATLLIGNLQTLFKDLLARLAPGLVPSDPPPPDGASRVPDASAFRANGGPADPRAVRTMISLAMLLQHTGKFAELLEKWLASLEAVKKNPELGWRVEHLQAHTKHTKGHLRNAISHMKRTMELKKANKPYPPGSRADDLVWLGYEHLCLAKRPNVWRPSSLLQLPSAIVRGLGLLADGAALVEVLPGPHIPRCLRIPYLFVAGRPPRLKDTAGSGRPNSHRPSTMAKYYCVDLLHSCASLLMLIGAPAVDYVRPFFGIVSRLYSQIAAESHLMEWEYYWLRHLEVRLLAAEVVDFDAVREQLDAIERNYSLVQENVQIGNTHAYRALIAFLSDKNLDAAEAELDAAAKSWAQAGPGVVAGARRIMLFRRFMFPSQTPLKTAMQVILGLPAYRASEDAKG